MSLSRNVLWTIAGQVSYAASQWVLLATLSKTGTATSVGIFSLALAVTTPIFAFTNLQLASLQATDRSDSSFSGYLRCRLIASSIALAAVLALVATQFGGLTSSIIFLIGIAKFFESLSDITYGHFQRLDDMKQVSKSLIGKATVLTLIGVGSAALFPNNLTVLVAMLIMAWGAFFVGYDLPAAMRSAKVSKAQSPCFCKALFWLGLPMGFVIMLNTLHFNLPRYAVEHFMGKDALGYYAAVTYLIIVGSTIINALAQASLARMAVHYNNDVSAFRALLLTMLFLAGAAGAVGVLASIAFGPTILRFFFTNDYAKFNELFIWSMIAAMLLYLATVLGGAATAARHFRSQAVIAGLVALLIGVSSYLLVPPYGLIGAVIAFGIAMVFKATAQAFSLWMDPKIRGHAYS